MRTASASEPKPASPSPSPSGSWAEAGYSVLLLLYPSAFREEYGEEMTAAFGARFGDARRSGPLAALGVVAAVVADTARTAASEHWQMAARDLRQAWRSLTARRNLPFSLASGATLALGIGGAVAIFALVHALLLAPLPFRQPERVVHVENRNAARNLPHYAISVPDFVSLRDGARSFSSLVAVQPVGANLSAEAGGGPERLEAMAVAGDLFQTLGQPMIAGRSFGLAEGVPGAGAVAVLGEGLWRRRFGADRSLVGRVLRIDGTPRTVIGIAPQDVGFTANVDLWLPLEIGQRENRGDRETDLIGRLRTGVSIEGARAELDRLAARLEEEFPQSNRGWGVNVEPVTSWVVGPELKTRLLVLLAAVGVLLLVACANVANLQLARAAARLREVAVRLALGAGPGRVVRHLMTENLLLAAVGGGAGLALAWAAVRGAAAFLPPTLPRLAAIAIDPAVAGFALVLVLGTALAFGLAPSILAARDGQVAATLRQSGRSGSAVRSPVREGLVAAQLALATLLAIGAALLAQSFLQLQKVPLGFRSDGVLTARLTLPEIRSEADHEQGLALCQALETEVRSLPGVKAVGMTSEIPMGEINTGMEVGAIRGVAGGAAPRVGGGSETKGAGSSGAEQIQASWRIVSADYLRALEVPLRAGRFFAPRGEPGDSVLLSEGLARRLFPGSDTVGRRIWIGNGQERTVVGVVGDVHQVGVAREPTPTMYFTTSWYLWTTMSLAVRTEGDPAALAGPLRQAMARVAPEVPLFAIRTLRSVVAADIAQPRLQASLVAVFAALALLLAAVGVAGIVAYAVAQRTPELAVRAALGAAPRAIVAQVLGRGLMLCGAGVLLGVGLAVLFGGGLEGLLYGVRVRAPEVYAGTALILLLVGALGCWLPARRAALIQPVRALQGD